MLPNLARTAAAAFFLCALPNGVAQTAHFDVVSVKPVDNDVPQRFEGGPGSGDPGRVTYSRTPLAQLIKDALHVDRDQIQGPGWIDSAFFQVTATMPPTTTLEQFRGMILNLLAERFGFKYHRGTRQRRGYALLVLSDGPRFGVHSGAGPTPPRCSLRQELHGGVLALTLRNCHMITLTDAVGRMLTGTKYLPERIPVADQTGMAGQYDLTLKIEDDPPPDLSEPMSPPDIRRALEQQLGLTIAPRTVTEDIIVIDHLDRTPTPN